jgi:hypothetical protein
VGSNDIFAQSTGLSLSTNVSNLPVNGSLLYVRLWWATTAAGWSFADYTYTAATVILIPAITSPVPGSSLTSSSQIFQWSSGTAATNYFLYVGSSVGANDIFAQSTGLNLSTNVSNLPVNGSTLYVRLWWATDAAGWTFADYTYTAATVITTPAITSPVPGSTLVSSSQTFQWSSGTEVTDYFLYVGSSVGSNDVFAQSTGLNLSTNVSNLPVNGSPLYVRLWWATAAAGWAFADYTYTAATVITTPAITSPVPGSTLASSSQTFQWSSGTAVTNYFLYVGSSVGANDIFGQSTGLNHSTNVTNLPVNGSTLYLRLWWATAAAGWSFADYTYTAATVIITPAITIPVPSSTLTSSSVTFKWNAGASVTNYYLSVGNSLGAYDIYGQYAGLNLSTTVAGLPTDGRTLYVTFYWAAAAGWQYSDYTYTAFTQSILPTFGSLSVAGGKLRATLSGLSPGETVVLYGSTNLQNWTSLQTNVLNSSTLTFTNSINPAIKGQYFRAAVQ